MTKTDGKRIAARNMVACMSVLVLSLALSGCLIDEAAPGLGDVVDRNTVELNALFASGKKELEEGRPGLALEKFKAALAKAPDSVRILNAVGASYDKLGRNDVAEGYYRRALTKEPGSLQTLNNIGYSLMLQGKYEDALPFLAQVAKVKDAEGLSLVAAGNYAAALEKLQRGASEKIERASLARIESDTGASRKCTVDPVWLERSGERVYTLITDPSAAAEAAMRQLSSAVNASSGVKGGPESANCNMAVRAFYGVVPRVSDLPRANPSPATGSKPVPMRDRVASSDMKRPEPAVEKAPLEPLVAKAPSKVPSKAAASAAPSVDVSNGAGRNKLAARMRDYFGRNGLHVDRITNAASFDHSKTVIFYREGFRVAAERYAKALPTPVGLEESSQLGTDLRVRLGSDVLRFDSAELIGRNNKLTFLLERWM